MSQDEYENKYTKNKTMQTNAVELSQSKLYFGTEDDEFCRPLSRHLIDAKNSEKKEITLIEAVKCNDNDYVFCSVDDVIVERCDCRKSLCDNYSSKSGRGKCENRGATYEYGDSKTFIVE